MRCSLHAVAVPFAVRRVTSAGFFLHGVMLHCTLLSGLVLCVDVITLRQCASLLHDRKRS